VLLKNYKILQNLLQIGLEIGLFTVKRKKAVIGMLVSLSMEK
jgi:hypothetical protein